ncbi:MAG TPA: hypothetical protein VIP70_11880 [Nitrososphaeraceae archaeon]
MPEIWLRYGNTDIVLDIRFENLYKEIRSDFPTIPQEKMNLFLQNIALKDKSLIVVLSASNATNEVLSRLIQKAHDKRLRGISIGIVPKLQGIVEPKNSPYNLLLLNENESVSLIDMISKFDRTIFLSQTSFDPLFGFSGAPTSIIRNFMKSKMSEAFSLRSKDLPNAGIIGEPYRLALSACSNINAISIEVVATTRGISDIYFGSMEESFSYATSQLLNKGIINEDYVKSTIISPGNQAMAQLTLAESLNSLWNSLQIIKEKGSAILLAESRNGLGAQALQMFVEGRLNPNEPKKSKTYIDGQEHITFIQETAQRYDLGIISTLPEYYLKNKLGFSTYNSLKEVLDNLMSRHGKHHKVLVLSDANITLVRPKS